MKTLLEVNNLNLTFEFNSQVVNAVKKSSFKIKKESVLQLLVKVVLVNQLQL